jgi:hypothetical protein
MGWYEHSELKPYDYITEWQAADSRHEMFTKIRHSDEILYDGGWGPERLHWNPKQEQGWIHCTEARHKEIMQWITDTVNECAPGNE